MQEQNNSTTPPIRQSIINQVFGRLRGLPWWLIILIGIFIYALYSISQSDQHRDILNTMLDRPQTATEDKYEVVYAVDVPVYILSEHLVVRLPAGNTTTINAAAVVERRQGALECPPDAPAGCSPDFGNLVVFRTPASPNETPDGTEVISGLLRPIGLIVELPNGDLIPIAPEAILSQEEGGTLACDRLANPDCTDLEGVIVSIEAPYVLRTALVNREDVRIRHLDGYEETVRPNRLGDRELIDCTPEDEPACQDGKLTTALYDTRVSGVEMGSDDDTITIRTINEQTEFIARERILSLSTGLVTCDRAANPRCQDFEGTFVARAGAMIEGELTLESNRSVNIIPIGATTALEVFKADIVSDTRTPENCRVEEEGACFIRVQQADDVVAGRIIKDEDAGLTVQTVAPVLVEVAKDEAQSIRRKPITCALNNLRGCNAGIWLTLLVTLVSYSLALVGGLVIGLMRVSSNPFLYHFSTLYVEVIRGMPLLVLLLIFAFVIGPLLRDTRDIRIAPLGLYLFTLPLGAVTQPFYEFISFLEVSVLGEESFLAEAVLGLAVGYAAFLAEVFRAGIESIGRGQMEAARSLGMSYPQAMRHVILPQAIRVVLPPLGNDFIAMLKDSALISVLALPDLLQSGRLYITRTFQPIPVYMVVALLYIILTLFLSMLVRSVERRFRLP